MMQNKMMDKINNNNDNKTIKNHLNDFYKLQT